jgi:aminopeptidase N
MGYPASDMQVWTQGEAELHRYWFPCYDYPNERFTTEVRCHAPEGMQVFSNGILAGKSQDANGLQVWHWKQEKPHVNYLIALAAGYFHTLTQEADGIPLTMSVPPSLTNTAEWAFRDTADIMRFFNSEIGLRYPWAKYAQVYCHDFVAGGMENTSCTLLAASELFTPAVEDMESVEGLDAHELAHQWFGDLVTCRDWSHLWLNEGFASYYPMLYAQKKHGAQEMHFQLWRAAQRVITSNDKRPIVWKDYGDPMQQFDSRAYPKGAWVLHMLRSQLGPELFRTAIRTYLETHQNGIATTDDLQDVLENVSGRSFDQFFDQWIHHGGVPEVKVDYHWLAEQKQAKLTIRQKQKISPEVPLFRFPLPVRFFDQKQPQGQDFHIIVSKEEEDFYFPLPAQPELVSIDPEFTVLAKWEYQWSAEMETRQMEGASFLGRMLAIQARGERKDDAKVPQLQKILQTDAHYSIRIAAATTLEKWGTEPTLTALQGSIAQPDARVREAVLRTLANHNKPDSHATLAKHATEERNPMLQATLLTRYATQPNDPTARQALLDAVQSTSERNIVATQAIEILRSLDERTAVPAILKRLQAALPGDFPTRSFNTSMEALAFLAREDKESPAVLDFLLKQLHSPSEPIRRGAATALGSLGQPRAVAALQRLTDVPKPFADPVREAAEKSIQAIQSQQRGAPDLQKLWSELQAVQKKNQELEKDIKKLQEQKPQKETKK